MSSWITLIKTDINFKDRMPPPIPKNEYQLIEIYIKEKYRYIVRRQGIQVEDLVKNGYV